MRTIHSFVAFTRYRENILNNIQLFVIKFEVMFAYLRRKM